MVDFAEYHSLLLRMLSTCIKEPHSHLAVFVMRRAGRAHLDFIQNMEYKFVELLSATFIASDDETVRQSISFRYNSVKSRLALMQARLQDIHALVKVKNPSLMLQLQRGSPRYAGARYTREIRFCSTASVPAFSKLITSTRAAAVSHLHAEIIRGSHHGLLGSLSFPITLMVRALETVHTQE